MVNKLVPSLSLN